jgi:hypothetical protein
MVQRLVVQDIPKIESYDDMLKRPDFQVSLDPAGVDLSKVKTIGRFGPWTDTVQCGLSTCHTWHGRGFLVQFPDLRTTNVGKDCGREKFGVEWLTGANEFERSEKNAGDRHAINAVLDGREELRILIRQLIEQPLGAEWLETGKRNFRETYPKQLCQALRDRCFRQDPRIFKHVRLQGRELEIAKLHNQSEYKEKLIGALRGLAIWGGDPKRSLTNVLHLIDKILATDLEDFPTREQKKLISQWATACKEIQSRIDQAALLIEEGRRFFSPENMKQLYLIVDGGAARATKFTVWDFEQNVGEALTESQYKRRLSRMAS